MALQGTPVRSRRSPARLRQPSWGFSPLQRHQREDPLNPGFHTRYGPPSEFLTLLTAYSLHAFRPRGPVPLMGFTLQSFSPPQSRTPLGAVALLPFLASRTLALRTRSSRCPAASGRCSLRRSVPVSGRNRIRADTLLGFCASPERSLRAGGPASRPLPSCALSTRPTRGPAAGAPGRQRTLG